jgi:hypothetical protein
MDRIGSEVHSYVRVSVYMQLRTDGSAGARPCFHLSAENDRRAAMFSVPGPFVSCRPRQLTRLALCVATAILGALFIGPKILLLVQNYTHACTVQLTCTFLVENIISCIYMFFLSKHRCL